MRKFAGHRTEGRFHRFHRRGFSHTGENLLEPGGVDVGQIVGQGINPGLLQQHGIFGCVQAPDQNGSFRRSTCPKYPSRQPQRPCPGKGKPHLPAGNLTGQNLPGHPTTGMMTQTGEMQESGAAALFGVLVAEECSGRENYSLCNRKTVLPTEKHGAARKRGTRWVIN